MSAWLDFLRSDQGLYLLGAYIVGLALFLIEVVLLEARERTILGHLGWTSAVASPEGVNGPRIVDAKDRDRP